MRRRAGMLLTMVMVAVLVAAAPRAGADPTQFRLFDQMVTHKATAAARVNQSAPPDWSTPVPYSTGRAYLRLQVTSKPSTLAAQVQLCLWRNAMTEETCSGGGAISTVGTYWFDLGVPSTWFKLNGIWSWNKPIDYAALMVKDAATGSLLMSSGCGAYCYTGTQNLAGHTPITFNASVIVVAPGAKLVAPTGWAKCPANWSASCTGGVVNRVPVADAGPDRWVAPGSLHTALSATVEDDGLPTTALTGHWSKVSGPGTVTFSAPTAAATRATFGSPGRYELAYHASDGQLADSDTVIVVVPTDGGAPTPRPAHLLVGNAAAPSAPDRAIRDRIVAKGWNVTLVDDNALTPQSLTGSQLVVISASVDALLVPAWLADLAVPILSSEAAAQPTLRLGTGPTFLGSQTTLTIAQPGHALAAGLANDVVTGTTGVYGSVAGVAPGATIVARLLGRPRAAVFAVETGAALTTGTAAARRVGFFLGPFTAPTLNADGWKLFDAAVDWLAPVPAPVAAAQAPVGGPWWDAAWAYRMPVSFTAPATIADHGIAEVGLDFGSALAKVGATAAFDPKSIRVVEVDGAGAVIHAAVPFQFDPAPGFSPAGYAVGTLTVLLRGVTTAHVARTLHVYFDTVTANHVAATVAPEVSVLTTTDAGGPAMKVSTALAAWYLQTANGGLSSIVDANNMDWLNFSSAPGPSGMYRGMPNSVFPEGHFHPGFPGMTTTLVGNGPLKASIRSVSNDGWRARWDFYPTFTTMTWEQTPTAFWFLYEGTPGGQIDLTSDRVIFADGMDIPLSGTRSGDLPGAEWAGFADTIRNRSLFVHNAADDTKPDTYYLMGGQMTVFGFGRDGLFPSLYGPNTFTMGLTDGSTHAALQTAVTKATTRPVAAVTRLETRV